MTNLKRLVELQSSNLTVREAAAALSMWTGAVSKYLTAIRAAGLTTGMASGLSEAELERRAFGEKAPARFAPVDCGWVHGELKRHRHVTLRLLWGEYRERHGAQAYRYSVFCDTYWRWEKRKRSTKDVLPGSAVVAQSYFQRKGGERWRRTV